MTKSRKSVDILHQSQKTFSDLVEGAPFGIYIVDSNFCISHMNAESQANAFRNVRPVIGRPFTEAMHILWPDSVAEGIISTFRNTLITGEPYHSTPFINPRQDIEIVEAYEWELRRVVLPDGQYGVICYYFDSTPLREAERKARESEEKYRNIVETAGEGIVMVNPEGKFQFINQKFAEMLGYTSQEILGRISDEFMYDKKEVRKVQHTRINLNKGERVQNDMMFKRKDGSLLWTLYNATPIFDSQNNHTGNLALHIDITERKQTEQALQASHETYMELVTNARSMIFKMDSKGKFTFVNEFALDFFGYKEEEIIGKTPSDTITPHIESSGRNLDLMVNKIYDDPDKYAINLNENIKRNGERVWVEWHNKALFDKKGNRTGHIAIGIDVTDRIKAEASLKESEERFKALAEKLSEAQEKLNMALEKGNIGIWEWNLITDEVSWDERLENMFGLDPGTFAKTFKAFENLVNEEDISHIQVAIKNALEKDLPLDTVFRTRSEDKKSKYLSTKAVVNRDKDGKPVSMLGVCFDVTGLKEGTEQVISKLNEELLRSNKDLESFAYVTSHDLQEPLRMVSSFTQLLEQQYKDKLDDTAREYIHFAVDGSKRMYDLLNGLLAYSRLHTKAKEFNRVELNYDLETAIKNLALTIKERNAVVESDDLPVVNGDRVQLIQLFQNLISNAIKFSTESPRIYISSKYNHDHYVISVKDEGIGIESEYFDKIFQIFQRLNPKDQYEGTGIGLAICKRIVERHGGRIWVESEPGKGSTFFLTFPKYDLA